MESIETYHSVREWVRFEGTHLNLSCWPLRKRVRIRFDWLLHQSIRTGFHETVQTEPGARTHVAELGPWAWVDGPRNRPTARRPPPTARRGPDMSDFGLLVEFCKFWIQSLVIDEISR